MPDTHHSLALQMAVRRTDRDRVREGVDEKDMRLMGWRKEKGRRSCNIDEKWRERGVEAKDDKSPKKDKKVKTNELGKTQTAMDARIDFELYV